VITNILLVVEGLKVIIRFSTLCLDYACIQH